MKMNGNARKSIKMHENAWKDVETHGNEWKQMEMRGNAWKLQKLSKISLKCLQKAIGVDLRLENAWDDVIMRILVKIVKNCRKLRENYTRFA